jgi:hypothetical protein
MEISFGKGKTEHGPGVQIDLTGGEVVQAIYKYLNTHNIHIAGPLTIRVNGEPCESGSVYVDPSGAVVTNNEVYSGRGHKEQFLANEANI